jgi:hypothetical protein
MSSTPLVCPRCGKPVISQQQYCFQCGSPLAWNVPGADSSQKLTPFQSASVAEMGPRARNRTRAGFTLMIVAFAILWIPYVGDLGALVALAGVVMLFLGREGFDESHRRLVSLGTTAVIIGLLVSIGVALWFVSTIISAATTPGETLTQVGAVLSSALGTLLVVALVATGLTSLGYVALPYALADRTSRILLWAGLAASLGIAVLVLSLLYPQITMAIAQATSGSTINVTPVQTLDSKSILAGAAQVGPDLMFLLAYYQTRAQIFGGPPGPAPGAGTEGKPGPGPESGPSTVLPPGPTQSKPRA